LPSPENALSGFQFALSLRFSLYVFLLKQSLRGFEKILFQQVYIVRMRLYPFNRLS
jgi:hypothetical protein